MLDVAGRGLRSSVGGGEAARPRRRVARGDRLAELGAVAFRAPPRRPARRDPVQQRRTADPPGRQGTSGLGGGPRGDLYLVVRLAPHPRYRVDGRDITVDLPVTPWEAAVGASVPVATPAGSVQVPPGSSSGSRLRLRGRGMPNPTGPLATCTPKSESSCRRGRPPPSASCGSGWPTRRDSTHAASAPGGEGRPVM
ncbi:DnaJ C-terminal domain-containing protein [Dactylosporangium sp. NPDC050588]|uniref:DnaJ C-terminal domain-containing protein n=1 Tax=Dactylosporangium sp. NPDC050588 TaxID=3157211 RepID=UPI0033E40CCE